MAQSLVIFGCGGHARVVADAADASGYRIEAFLDRTPRPGATMLGFPVWPEDDVLKGGRGLSHCVVAVGDNSRRARIAADIAATRPDLAFATIVHPRATVSRHATLGAGTVVLAGAIVCAAARVGRHVSLYTQTIVEHDDVIDDFVTLAPAAALGGTVRVGARAFLGMGAIVIHNTSIGADVVVGANATVTADLPDCAVAVGSPARIIRTRRPDEPYLD